MKPVFIALYVIGGLSFAWGFWPRMCKAESTYEKILPSAFIVATWPAAVVWRIGLAAADPVRAINPAGCPAAEHQTPEVK